MARCVVCGASPTKAVLSDKGKVCERCWFQAGFYRMDQGFGSGFGSSQLDTREFKSLVERNRAVAAKSEILMLEKVSVGSFGFIGFNDPQQKLILKMHHRENDDVYLYEVYPYDAIENFDVVQRNTMTSSHSGGIGRAIAGGLLFGAAGAIVGAATAKQEFTITNDQDIVLVLRDQSGLKNVRFMARQEVLLKLQDIFGSRPAPEGQAEPAVADRVTADVNAILKYKELLDVGVITEEEFRAKKAQILGI